MTYFENESELKNLSLILKQATKYTRIYLSNMGKTACEGKKMHIFLRVWSSYLKDQVIQE